MSLFKLGDFILHSGSKSNFFIDCDALADADWQALARLIYDKGFRFRKVVSIPKGGLKLAEALKPYCFPNPEYPVLVVDDVLTTGKSMEEEKEKYSGEVKGVVIFSRGVCPDWITPIFQLHETFGR